MNLYCPTLYLSVVFALQVFFCSAQNDGFWKDIKRVSENLNANKFYKADITFTAYDSTMDSHTAEIVKGTVVKENNNINFKNEYEETFYCKRFTILIDHLDKSIIVLPPQKKNFAKITGFKINQLDTLIDQSFLKQNDSVQQYDVFLKPYSNVKRIIFYISKTNKVVTRITVYYNSGINSKDFSNNYMEAINKTVLDINYSNIILNLKPGSNELSYKNYFIKKGKKFIPSEKFAEYTIDPKYYFNRQ